jgi:hypothetical protein
MWGGKRRRRPRKWDVVQAQHRFDQRLQQLHEVGQERGGTDTDRDARTTHLGHATAGYIRCGLHERGDSKHTTAPSVGRRGTHGDCNAGNRGGGVVP